MDVDVVVVYLKQQPDMSIRHDIRIPFGHHQSNLLIVASTACTKKELDIIRPHLKYAMASFNHNSVVTDHWNAEVDEFEYEFDYDSKTCCPCVGVEMQILPMH